MSRCVGRAVRRSGARSHGRGRCGAVPRDRSGDGLSVEHGLHATQIAMRLGERLGIDPQTAAETYYACLLSYCGCTADAEVADEVFGGDLTESFGPVLFGSPREMLTGIIRSLPDPDSVAPTRAVQIARRLPKAAVTRGRTWWPCARSERCSRSRSACRARCTTCSSTAPSAGTVEACCGARAGNRSRWR